MMDSVRKESPVSNNLHFSLEHRLQMALDAAEMAIWQYSIATDEVTANPELNRLLGYPPDAQLSLPEIRSLFLPGEREKVRQEALSALASGKVHFEAQFQARRADGQARWFQMRAEIIKNDAGSPTTVLGVVFDITPKKESEQQYLNILAVLKEREQELSAALRAGALVPFEYDMTTLKMKHSERLNELYGYPPDHELSLSDIRARYHPDTPVSEIETMISQLNDPAVREFEIDLRLLLPGDKVRWLHGRGEYLRDESGRACRARGVVMDATERKELERRQQLLVDELSHRIKNTLAMIVAIAHQTFKSNNTLKAAENAFVGRVYALAGAHDLVTRSQWSRMEIKDVIENALRPYVDGNRITIDGPSWKVSARQGLGLTLAIHELATNAIKYGALAAEGGRVAIHWEITQPQNLELTWNEQGVVRPTEAPKAGFGSKLVKQVAREDFRGSAEFTFGEAGLVWTLRGHADS